MKVYLFFLLLLLLNLPFLSYGQYHRGEQELLLGVNAGYFYPTGDMGKILKNGIGGNISLKYLINEVLGIGFESGYYGFKSKLNLDNANTDQEYKCHLTPVLLEASFYFPTWNRTTLPYMGLQFGGYLTQIKVSQKCTIAYSHDISKNLFLFSPGAGVHGGVLFQLSSDRCWMDVRIRADYVPKIEDKYEFDEYTQGNIGFHKMLNIGANIGILYKF